VRYNEITRRYFNDASGVGILNGADVVSGSAGRRERGHFVRFFLRVRAARIEAARFQCLGCPHSIAVCAYLTSIAAGAPLPGLPEGVAQLVERFAVPKEKTGRLLAIEDAWIAAAKQALGKG
jgi:hypothetical protein